MSQARRVPAPADLDNTAVANLSHFWGFWQHLQLVLFRSTQPLVAECAAVQTDDNGHNSAAVQTDDNGHNSAAVQTDDNGHNSAAVQTDDNGHNAAAVQTDDNGHNSAAVQTDDNYPAGQADREHVWEYQAANDMWCPYSDPHQTHLEAAFSQSKQFETLTVQGTSYRRSYTICFSRREQRNLFTGRVRMVRRRRSRIHDIQEDANRKVRRAQELAQQHQQQEELRQRELSQTREELETQKRKSESSKAELSQMRQELWTQKWKSESSKAELSQTRQELETQKRKSESSKAELVQTRQELWTQKWKSESSKAELSRKETQVAELLRYNSNLSIGSLSRLPELKEMRHGEVRREWLCEELPEYGQLKKMFEGSLVSHRKIFRSYERCPPPDVAVTGIQQVINPFKQPSYEAARREVLGRNPNGCHPIAEIAATKCKGALGSDGLNFNEYFLFHGTRYDTVDDILRNGLDPQRGGESAGAMFGRGLYFAENASKSDLYTTCELCARERVQTGMACRHPTGTRYMLVAQVLLGASNPVKSSDKERLRAADRPDGIPYDSHTALKKDLGGCVDHMEYIIFKEQLSLVRFLIFYRHTPKCECKDCFHRRQ